MSFLDPDQRGIAETLFALPAAAGFALAGGSALVAHGAIDRPTRDIDAFIGARPGTPPGDVRPLASELTEALTADGWVVTTIRSHETFSRMVTVRHPTSIEIDLAVDSPPLFPIENVDGLPVLAPQDLAARKVLAIIDRAEGRDFTDLQALAGQFGREACIGWARQLDDGLSTAAIAGAFTNLERLADHELPCSGPDPIRNLFSTWRRELLEAGLDGPTRSGLDFHTERPPAQ